MKKNPNIKPLGFFAKIANYLMGGKGTMEGIGRQTVCDNNGAQRGAITVQFNTDPARCSMI